MGKTLLQDLASALCERKGLSKKDGAHFVNEMFNLIQKTLEQERLVKVKGLGTFKIIDVDDRESIDVNTGGRVLIEGHNKITFTPDSLMKELVNKPFSQFETVVLNEGVDFDDAPEPSALTIEEEVPPSVVPEEKVPESATPEEGPEPVSVVQPLAEEMEPMAAPLPEEDTPVGRSYRWPLIVVAACCLGFLLGYLVGHHATEQAGVPERPAAEVVEQQPEKELQAPVAEAMDTLTEKEATASEEAPAKPVVAQEVPESASDDFEKYNQMDNRVRTGAYRIVGTDQVLKARQGDDVTRICKRTLGPGMECYIEVYNGIKANAQLSPGQEIKIPKLELKKKKPRKAA